MIKHIFSLVVLVAFKGIIFFSCFTSKAQNKNAQYSIEIGSRKYPIKSSNNSRTFQKAIEDVHEKGGGKVVIPAGKYHLGNIQMKSNVHLIFKGKTTIYPYIDIENKSVNVFNFGMKGAIENVSLVGSKEGTIFDFSKLSNKNSVRAVILGECKNFKVSNFTVQDNQTIFSSITLTWCGIKDGVAKIPRNGTIENIIANNANYGYGSIQAHSGEKITFKNIKSIGGVAVRLETGYKKMNKARIGGLADITVENIMSVNGQGALFFQPHTMTHGDVIARNIQSDGSEFAVYMGVEFVSRKKFGEGATFPPGSFKSIHVDGIKAIYRDGPNVTRYGHLKLFPEALRHLVFKVDNHHNRYRGPSIAPVGLMNSNAKNVTIKNIESIGFKHMPDIATPKDKKKWNIKGIPTKKI